jgi:hypothetical protein
MIFLFGTRETHLRTVPTPGYACPACANNESLSLLFFSRYAHLFFVPLFPFSRRTLLVCSNCQQKGPESVIPGSLQPMAQQLKKQIGRPWWHFLGLILLAVPVAFFGFAALTAKPEKEQKQEEAAMLRQPNVGDVYVLHTEQSDKVALLRVQRVVPDTVYVSPSKTVEGSFMAYQHSTKPETYQDASYAMPISSLEILHKQDRLYDVLRD